MKNIKYLLLLGLFLLQACSGGYLYWDKPALEFDQIDYGFVTKKALNNPFISFIDEGNGENTLILIHGLASNAGFWRYNIPELSKHFRVIAVDLPGYGKSQKGNYPYTLSFYAESIKNLIDELNLKNVTLIGHSMGGQISIIFALKYPEKLSKLVLAAPAGFEKFQRGEGDWLRNAITMSGVKATTEEGIRRNLSNNFYTWSDKFEWMVEERVRMRKAKDFEEFTYTVDRCVDAMLDEPTYDKLSGIKVPTLIIHGKSDGLIPNPYLNPGFPSDVFEKGEKEIPNAKRIEIDCAGHMIMMERPDEFNNAVINFLKQ